MQLKNFLLISSILALGAAMVSCSNNDTPDFNDEGSKVDLPATRAFVLFEGSYGLNNSGITFFNPYDTKEVIPDIFYTQNAVKLGDMAQDMIEEDDNIYVSVHGSNYLAKLNSAGVMTARQICATNPDLQGGIRNLAADKGYIYASFYGGIVAKFDAKTLELKATLKTTGKNLEGIAIEDGKIYVANSYEITTDETGKTDYKYLDEVITIDQRSFTQSSTIKVTSNPNMVIEADDKIFVISNDYSQESYVLSEIDPAQNNRVTRIGYATDMTSHDHTLYLVDSRTDFSSYPYLTSNSFMTYDIRTGKLNSENFLKNAPLELATSTISSMACDDETGDIYINVTHYVSGDGELYRFDRNGNFIEKIACGGQNPCAMVFLD